MAASDAQRGAMGEHQMNRIKKTVEELVNGLDTHEDRRSAAKQEADSDTPATAPTPGPASAAAAASPPALALAPAPDTAPEAAPDTDLWQNEAAVLCVAGRGPLDEAASAMLAQLVDKHGMGSRLVSFEEVSRERIGGFDVTGATMVCISYLDISGSPAHLRYLIRRLRQRLPAKTPILVGLWPAEDSTLKDQQMQLAIGADYYTSTLKEAVAACETARSLQAETLREAA